MLFAFFTIAVVLIPIFYALYLFNSKYDEMQKEDTKAAIRDYMKEMDKRAKANVTKETEMSIEEYEARRRKIREQVFGPSSLPDPPKPPVIETKEPLGPKKSTRIIKN